MSVATFSVRMDEDLKKQFEAICAEMGMNMTTAVNIFARAVINQQKIPFIVSAQFKEKEQAE